MQHLVAPSILAANFNNLDKEVKLVNNSQADWFHLDVMDGLFVPNISFGIPIVKHINKIAKKPLDVHLMIENPSNYIEKFKNCGADILTVHYEACKHLHRVIENMSDTYGAQLQLDEHIRHSFPSPQQLVAAGEQKLRELGLGFRAPYVDKTTTLVNENRLDLQALIHMPYEIAKQTLMECPGIGPKIADCILVFSLEKMEAFPIDVWVRRALGDWYFPNQKTPSNQVLQSWAQNYFGTYGGYAQQYLFHGRRLQK